MEESDGDEPEYTNTITNLIELPSKQSATLKRMTRPKQVGGKSAPNRAASLSNLSSLFKNRGIAKQDSHIEEVDDEEEEEEHKFKE